MAQKVYVILYADGSLGIFGRKMGKHHFPKQPKQFECDYALTLNDLCEWQARNFNHPRFKEVGFDED